MNVLMLLAAMSLGQFSDPCGYSVVVGPTTYIDYLYGEMRVESKIMTQVKYSDGRYWNVYIVNGYVPAVTVTSLASGGVRYVFDYRCRIPYRKPEPRPQPEIDPRYLPGPEPEPPPAQSVVVPKREPTLAPRREPTLAPKSDPISDPPPVLPEPLPFGMAKPSAIAEPGRVIRPQYERPE